MLSKYAIPVASMINITALSVQISITTYYKCGGDVLEKKIP
jgi:hypothetical protein